MSKVQYPNRDALNRALDYYLDAMSQFVGECLDEQSIREFLKLQSSDDLIENIEFTDIASLIKSHLYWSQSFNANFKIVDRDDIRYYDARSVTSLIIEGRNRTSHPPWDLDPEFTRTQLFLIADILRQIKRPNAQREVEDIRKKLFDDVTEQLVAKQVKSKKTEYEKSLAEVKKRLAAEEANNKELSKRLNDKEAKLGEKTEELEELAGKFVNMRTSKQKVEKQLDAESKKLEDEETKRQACEGNLTTMQNLLTVSTIGTVYPPIETDSTVRILDRRGVPKQNYLLELLEQKQPTIIYVQSEDKIDQLLESVVQEKADLIERHGEQTSESEEMEILEKLENAEKIAVVSDTTLSALASSHCIEHFVFCHLVPSLDKFFKQCEPAFTSEKQAYLHLIYNDTADVKFLDEWLTQKYPSEKTLRKLYEELSRLAKTGDGFIEPENVYNENIYNKFGMAKLGVETGLAIFEELQFLDRNERGVKVLPDPEKRDLGESKIHCSGEALRQGIADAQALQLKQPIEQIWEEIKELFPPVSIV